MTAVLQSPLVERVANDRVKIWSFEHDAWWRPDSRGYTTQEADAGLYERKEAEEIVKHANYGGSLNEEIVEIVTPPLKEQIAALIREINAQDNRATASPYYFVVQSKRWVEGDGEDGKEVIHSDGLFTLEEWQAQGPDSSRESWEKLNPFWVYALWEDKGVFLTEKAALLFIRANRHHLTEPRTYVKHFWRNSQMETVMRALEEFSGEKLVWR